MGAVGKAVRWAFKYRPGRHVNGIVAEQRRRIWRFRISRTEKQFLGSLNADQTSKWQAAKEVHTAFEALWNKSQGRNNSAADIFGLTQARERRKTTEQAFVTSLSPAQKSVFDKLNRLYE